MDTSAPSDQGGGPRVHHAPPHLQTRPSPTSASSAADVRAASVSSSGAAASSSAGSSMAAGTSAGSSSTSGASPRPHKRKMSHGTCAAAAAAAAASGATPSLPADEIAATGRDAFDEHQHGDQSTSSSASSPSYGRRASEQGHEQDEAAACDGSLDHMMAQPEADGSASALHDAYAVSAGADIDQKPAGAAVSEHGSPLSHHRCLPSPSTLGPLEAPDAVDHRDPRSSDAFFDRLHAVEPTASSSRAPLLDADAHERRMLPGARDAAAPTTPMFSSFFLTAPHSSSPSFPAPPAMASAGPSSPLLVKAAPHIAAPASKGLRARFLDDEPPPPSPSRSARPPTPPRRHDSPGRTAGAHMRRRHQASSRRISGVRHGEELPVLSRLSELHNSSLSAFRRLSTGDKATAALPSAGPASHDPPVAASGATAPADPQAEFTLLPVPAAKRRKIASPLQSVATASASDDAPMDGDVSSAASHRRPERESSGTDRRQPIIIVEDPAARTGACSSAGSSAVEPRLERRNAAAASHGLNVPSSASRSSRGPSVFTNALKTPAATGAFTAAFAPRESSRSGHRAPGTSSSSRRRFPRLRRTQSLPNLKARPLLDLAAPVSHRLQLPVHLAQYLASITRSQERSAAAADGSTSRSGTSGSSSSSRSVFTPPLHPPITRHTLRELDLSEILKNPQLRHDVVFDPNVQFRPNFDGERGRRKRDAGDKYWAAVAREIEKGCTCTAFEGRTALPCNCPAERGSSSSRSSARAVLDSKSLRTPMRSSYVKIPPRIPHLIQELRAICLLILPAGSSGDTLSNPTSPVPPTPSSATRPAKESKPSTTSAARLSSAAAVAQPSSPGGMSSHHALIMQTLDPALITQELAHGVLDVSALISFLGAVLKLHCAPMRDEAIERMIATVVELGDVGRGLRMCFEILELMKLDIANHQLRTARPYLVDTAVEFETRWFKEQIDAGKLSIERTATWFGAALQRTEASASPMPLATARTEHISRAFVDGFLRLIFEAPAPPLSGVAPALPGASGASSSTASAAGVSGLGAGVALSSSSLNHAYTSFFPETFQFDAYRLVTFHADTTDITVMYMLLLLFRQLACSPLVGGDGVSTTLSTAQVASNAAALAQRHVDAIKEEIWCLLCDANLSVCAPAAASRSSAAADGVQPRTPSTPSARTAAIVLGGATGAAKLEDVRWRTAMSSVLLQVAARAGAIQRAARSATCLAANGSNSTLLPTVGDAPPSAQVLALLTSWLDTNMRAGSALHKLCQRRFREVAALMLSERLNAAPRSQRRRATPGASIAGVVRKEGEHPEALPEAKRIRGEDGEALTCELVATKSSESASSTATAATSTASRAEPEPRAVRPPGSAAHSAAPALPTPPAEWEAALRKAGLEPLGAEVRLLAERMAKVALFHLRVMRPFYERLASADAGADGAAAASVAVVPNSSS